MGLSHRLGGFSRWPLPKKMGRAWGMAMRSPSVDTSLAVVEAVGMCRKRKRSSASPSMGDTTSTDRMKATPTGKWLLRTKTSKRYAARKDCAPKARLNTPVARKVSTRPTAMRAKLHP